VPRHAPGSSSAGHPGPRRDPVTSILPVPSPGTPTTVPRSGTTSATLLLNATYEPLCVVSSRRAIVLVLAQKAEPVDTTEDVVHAALISLPVPIVVRLTRYVRVPFPASVPLSRRAVFTRDGQTCVYCGGSATSIDHVVPRSRGGTHTWDNVVAACRRCNHTKADRSLAEMGWALPHPPRTPSGAAWRLLGTRTVDPRWREWLGVPESVSA
jgi:5-methylcytosine-specific restriction endonuclease McrA